MPEKDFQAIISLHDVMPETLPRVKEILARLKAIGLPPFTLLVVPGCKWNEEQLQWLRERATEGYILAAHGWVHDSGKPRRAYHRLHSALISRNVAEHLALEPEAILPFIERSCSWFTDQGLPPPALYVPPAWALGRIKRMEIQQLVGRLHSIEVLRGFIEVATGLLSPLPLVGYEVDTAWRKAFVSIWNTRNLKRARQSGKPLRIGIHPNDFQLLLADDLEKLLTSPHLTPVDFPPSCKT